MIGHRQTSSCQALQAYGRKNVVGVGEANDIKPLDPNQHDHSAISHNHYNATKFVVVTAPRSYATQVKGQGVNNTLDMPPTWRALVRDEFHHDKSRNQTVQLFEEIAHNQTSAPSTWLLSGTPFERGPADVAHWLNALVVENWENDETLSLALPEKFKELSSRVTTILNKTSNRTVHEDRFLESAASKFGSIISRLMIRFRCSRSRELGRRGPVLVPQSSR